MCILFFLDYLYTVLLSKGVYNWFGIKTWAFYQSFGIVKFKKKTFYVSLNRKLGSYLSKMPLIKNILCQFIGKGYENRLLIFKWHKLHSFTSKPPIFLAMCPSVFLCGFGWRLDYNFILFYYQQTISMHTSGTLMITRRLQCFSVDASYQ